MTNTHILTPQHDTSSQGTQPMSHNIHHLKEDGVDHINIKYGDAKTTLGKALGIQTLAPFVHPVLGPFNSIEGFWHFIKTRGVDDRMRTMVPNKIRRLAKNHRTHNIPQFRDIIVDGYYHRIVSDPETMALFLENTLPLITYRNFVSNEQVLRIEETRIRSITTSLEELAQSMREGHEHIGPDYTKIFPDLFKAQQDN